MTGLDSGFAYAPGAWTCLTQWPVCLLIDLTPPDDRLAQLSQLLSGEGAVEAVVDALTAQGVSTSPSFGLIQVSDDQVRVVVHGQAQAEIDGQPWQSVNLLVEQYAGRTSRVILHDGQPNPDVTGLFIAAGVARAGVVIWQTSPAEPPPGKRRATRGRSANKEGSDGKRFAEQAEPDEQDSTGPAEPPAKPEPDINNTMSAFEHLFNLPISQGTPAEPPPVEAPKPVDRAKADPGRTQIAPLTSSLAELHQELAAEASPPPPPPMPVPPSPTPIPSSKVRQPPAFIDTFEWEPVFDQVSSSPWPTWDSPPEESAEVEAPPVQPAPPQAPPAPPRDAPPAPPLPPANLPPAPPPPPPPPAPVPVPPAPPVVPPAPPVGPVPPAPLSASVPPPPPVPPVPPPPQPVEIPPQAPPVPPPPPVPPVPPVPPPPAPNANQLFPLNQPVNLASQPTPTPDVPPLADPEPPFGATVVKSSLTQLTSTGEVMVVATSCPQGHYSPPYATLCRVCGAPLDQRHPAVEVPRPVLGTLKLWGGGSVYLDRGVVFGRNPRPIPGLVGPEPSLVRIEDPNRDVSSQHCEVRLEDWFVTVRDLNSTNGTQVILPHRPPVTLRPQEPMAIEPGTRVILAQAFDFTFEVV